MKTILNLLKCMLPKKICRKFNLHELVVYNKTGEFGNDQDILLYIGRIRYGRCTEIPKKQYWYSGYLLKVKNNKRKAVTEFHPYTGILNAQENHLISIQEYLNV